MSDSDSKEIWVKKFKPKRAEKFREKVMEKSREDPDKPIVVYINSSGGGVHSMASMVETIESVPNPIVTVCMGFAASAAAILFSFGDQRFCGPNSTIMIHEFSAGFRGGIEDVAHNAKAVDRLNEYWMGRLAKNCGMDSYEEFKEKVLRLQDGRNVWLNSEEALDLGIADQIGVPEIETDFHIINTTQESG